MTDVSRTLGKKTDEPYHKKYKNSLVDDDGTNSQIENGGKIKPFLDYILTFILATLSFFLFMYYYYD